MGWECLPECDSRKMRKPAVHSIWFLARGSPRRPPGLYPDFPTHIHLTQLLSSPGYLLEFHSILNPSYEWGLPKGRTRAAEMNYL